MASLPTPQRPAAAFTIRLAHADDVAAIDWLDTFGTSPHRNINRYVAQYFGSVDPSRHEQNVIFLAELLEDVTTDQPYRVIGKAELLIAPDTDPSEVGYIKRVIVQPDWRGQGIARAVLEHIRTIAPDYGIRCLDLHAWEGNRSALRLYESLGFVERHREIYMRLSLDAPIGDAAAPMPHTHE